MIDISKHITGEIKEEYYNKVKGFLDAQKYNKLNRAIKESKKDKDKISFIFIKENLREIILLPPEKLKKFDKSFSKVNDIKFFKERMYHYYQSFFYSQNEDDGGNNAYWLLKKLNIRTCPYCNRNYTLTVRTSTGKLVRPEFDHFYPKTKKPWLALSLYNLVPSCPTCNHTKKEEFISDNPYNNKPSDITIEYDSINDKVKVAPEGNKNVKVFGLQQLYEEHVDYAQDVFNKAIAYNPDIYDVLLNSFQGLVKTHEELERLIWGTYLDEENFDKRPMSKLTSDILKQLGII